ncbi:MAG: hypothetical protein HN764_10510 [Gammaproteobacteria bacterium]|nr:hypothetical protein [Gammaproteobacteria bacterium]
MSDKYRQFFRKTPVKIILLIIYLGGANLLAGFVAVWFRFPSLWGNGEVFIDYALPVNFTYALSHWPSLLLCAAPIMQMADWNTRQIRRIRKICLILLLVIAYGLIEKIPFALFPAIDLLFVFIISLLIAPPTLKENPIIISVILGLLAIAAWKGSSIFYFNWKHQVPVIKQVEINDGLYELLSIDVKNRNKELVFDMELTRHIAENDLCDMSTAMFTSLIESYPFDNTYHRLVEIKFNPVDKKRGDLAYRLGYLIENKENDGRPAVACYLKYKK